MASYIYGNVVRKEHTESPKPEKKKEVSRQVRTNRTRAMHMSRAYVTFLAVSSAVTLFACVQYLHLQSGINKTSAHINELRQELAETKEENTTRYNLIRSRMNLEEIRDTAMRDYGMVYASPEQIIRYERAQEESVTQYMQIPGNGITKGSASGE